MDDRSNPGSKTRRVDVDWLRVFATYLLFPFHAAMVFNPAPFYHVRNADLSMGMLTFAGFVTLCMDSLPLSREERGAGIRYQWISALKLAQLGIDRRFQGSGLGRWVVGFVVDFATELSLRVGCRYVTLDAQPDLVSWYSAQGFRRNLLHQQQRMDEAIRHRRDPANTAVSMRFDIREHAG